MSQAAILTGVSERQIQHWMDRGYVLPADGGTRKIGGESLDTILLIKQARLAGIPLRQAVPMAREYLRQEVAGALDDTMSRLALKDLQERLTVARVGMDLLQAIIHDVSVAGDHDESHSLPRPGMDRVSSQGRK